MNAAEENRIRALTGQPPLLTQTNEKSELEGVLIEIQDRKNARERLDGIIQRKRQLPRASSVRQSGLRSCG